MGTYVTDKALLFDSVSCVVRFQQDKYDVDKALADVDGGGPVDNGPADDENDAIAEAERAFLLQQHMGNEEKERGNAQFKNGKFMAAIECYSRGTSLLRPVCF